MLLLFDDAPSSLLGLQRLRVAWLGRLGEVNNA